MKRLIVPAIMLLAACQAPTESVTPVTRAEIADIRPIQEERYRIGRDEVRAEYWYSESERVLDIRLYSSITQELVAHMEFALQDAAYWELIAIEAGPCICDPECSAYSEDLCRWWSCVHDTISAHDVELGLISALCPECGGILVSSIMFNCAQPGASTSGN